MFCRAVPLEDGCTLQEKSPGVDIRLNLKLNGAELMEGNMGSLPCSVTSSRVALLQPQFHDTGMAFLHSERPETFI